MARRPPRKVTYFEPVPSPPGVQHLIESTFEVCRRFRCTVRIDCSALEPGAVMTAVGADLPPTGASATSRKSLG
jgi:hypothetical protein